MVKWSDIPRREATVPHQTLMDMQRADTAAEMVKAVPPTFVAGLTVFGASLDNVVLVATLIYVVLQSGFLIHRWWRMAHRPNTPSGDDDRKLDME
jgi:hypothetical protein